MFWRSIAAGLIFGAIGTLGEYKCGKLGEIGGPCFFVNNAFQCHNGNYVPCHVETGTCTCPYGSDAGCNYCVRGEGSICPIKGQPCDDGAECNDSKCTCIVGKQHGTIICLKLKAMKCNTNSNCAESQGLSCENQVCTCTKPGNAGSPCFKDFNEICDKDKPCAVNPVQGLECVDGHCVCPPNQEYVGNKCQLPIGEDCQLFPDRCGYDAVCDLTLKTCACGKYAALSQDTGFCKCQKDAFRSRVSLQCECPSNADMRTHVSVCQCLSTHKLDINQQRCVQKPVWGK